MEKSELCSLPDASLLRRLTAGMYDLFLLFAVGFFYTMVLTLIANSMGQAPTGLVVQESGEDMMIVATDEYQPMLQGVFFQLGLYLSLSLFYVGFWRTRSATLGMQTWRMQLINLEGNPPKWHQLGIRALAGTFSLLFFGLGFFYSLVDRQNRTLHDIVSGTRVIVLPKKSKKS